MEPGSYETETSGMARVHRLVEELVIEHAPRYLTRASDPHQVVAVASFCENVLEYVHVHHGAEDELLYPRLEERCADHVDSVRRVWSQHELLDVPMAAAGDAINRWRIDPRADNTAALCDALSAFSKVLTPHCRDEEEMILPLASRYLSEAEWVEMFPHEAQNYRADKSWLMLGLTLERYDEAQGAALLARLPEARRTLWNDEWSSAFQEFMTDVRA